MEAPAPSVPVGAARQPVLIMNPHPGGGKANPEFTAAAGAVRRLFEIAFGRPGDRGPAAGAG